MKDKFMKNGVFSLEYDKETLKDLVLKLQEKNVQLEEQAAYLRRSCERKEEKIYEQYDEIVGLDTKIDKMIEDINFCLHSIKQEMKLSKDERTRSEMTNCYKILSVYEKGDKK